MEDWVYRVLLPQAVRRTRVEETWAQFQPDMS